MAVGGPVLLAAARDVGLDMAAFERDLDGGAYRAAVRAAYSAGSELRTAFDYYRGRVLRRFNLKVPADIDQERVVWLKLAAFIRRGESFYFPSEFRREGSEE